MSQPPQNAEALGALERLYAKNVISLEEGKAAARLIARDDAYEFPQPAKPPAPAETPQTGNGDGTSPG